MSISCLKSSLIFVLLVAFISHTTCQPEWQLDTSMPVYQHESGDSSVDNDPSGENLPPIQNPPDVGTDEEEANKWLPAESFSVGNGPSILSRLTGW
jgi:hypothetical protein